MQRADLATYLELQGDMCLLVVPWYAVKLFWNELGKNRSVLGLFG